MKKNMEWQMFSHLEPIINGLDVKKLREEYGITEEVLDRFDKTARHNCCNVISITLYTPTCSSFNKLLQYLSKKRI